MGNFSLEKLVLKFSAIYTHFSMKFVQVIDRDNKWLNYVDFSFLIISDRDKKILKLYKSLFTSSLSIP